MKYVESIMLDHLHRLQHYINPELRQSMYAPLSACVSVSVVRSVITAAASSDTHEGPSHDHEQPQFGSEARLIWDDHFY